MNSTVSIRDYGIDDLEEIFRLDEVCFAPEFRFDRDSMRIFAETEGAIVRLAQSGDELAGFVIVHREEATGYIVTLDVAETWRRRGIASLLMEDAEAKARAAGAEVMGLHVFTGNAHAIGFYERMGYERAGIRRNFYHEGVDAFVYRKEL